MGKRRLLLRESFGQDLMNVLGMQSLQEVGGLQKRNNMELELANNGSVEAVRNGNGGNGSTDNQLRKLYLAVAVLLSIISFGKTFFFADTAGVRLEERQLNDEKRIDKIETEFVRKDVIDPQLTRMEAVVTRQEEIVREQTQVLDKLQARMDNAQNRR